MKNLGFYVLLMLVSLLSGVVIGEWSVDFQNVWTRMVFSGFRLSMPNLFEAQIETLKLGLGAASALLVFAFGLLLRLLVRGSMQFGQLLAVTVAVCSLTLAYTWVYLRPAMKLRALLEQDHLSPAQHATLNLQGAGFVWPPCLFLGLSILVAAIVLTLKMKK